MTRKRKRCDRQFKIAAAQVALSGEVAVKELSAEPQIKDSALRRRADGYESMGEDAFPGNGSPKVDKDCETVGLRKRIEDLGRENDLLKKFRAFLSQDRAPGPGSRKSAGRSRPHQEGPRGAGGLQVGLLRVPGAEKIERPDRARGPRAVREGKLREA